MKKILLVLGMIMGMWGRGQYTWKQKANFPGTKRCCGVSFSIGNKGYIALGIGNSSNTFNDIWEYDTATNAWTQKATFPGVSRSNLSSFVIGTKAYLGAGVTIGNSPLSTHDFWEYNQTTNVWTQKPFWGTWVENQTGFSIGGKGYFCGGWDGGHYRSDLWQYDTLLNHWSQKAKFANGLGNDEAVAFTIGNYAYMGTGSDSTAEVTKYFWRYDPVADIWTQIADFGGLPRRYAVGFALNGKGYVGSGISAAGVV